MKPWGYPHKNAYASVLFGVPNNERSLDPWQLISSWRSPVSLRRQLGVPEKLP